MSSHTLIPSGLFYPSLVRVQKRLLKPFNSSETLKSTIFLQLAELFHASHPVVTWSSLHLGLTHLLLCSTTVD